MKNEYDVIPRIPIPEGVTIEQTIKGLLNVLYRRVQLYNESIEACESERKNNKEICHNWIELYRVKRDLREVLSTYEWTNGKAYPLSDDMRAYIGSKKGTVIEQPE